MPRLSIIVPIYAVEKYLAQCLDSVLSQDFTDFEIVGIDDCSPDSSGAILDEYAARDSRIKALHLDENVGLGRARNAGIEACTGDYFVLLDSDDTYEAGSLRAIADSLVASHDPDVLVFNYARVWDDGRYTRSWAGDVLAQLSGAPFNTRDHIELLSILPISCNKVYNREFIARIGLTFKPGYYEDLSWTYTALLSAQRVATMDLVVLLYRQRETGNILSTTSTKHFDIFAQYDAAFALLDDSASDAKLRKHLYDSMINHFVAVLQHPGRLATSDKRRFFATASKYAIMYQPGDDSQLPQNRPTNFRASLMRKNMYDVFASYSWADTKRPAVRRLMGKGYWKARRGIQIAGRTGYAAMRLAPVDEKRIVFSEYWATGYRCNPRAIYEQLQRTPHDLKPIWVMEADKVHQLPPGTATVTQRSPKFWWYMARGRYFINNVNFPPAVVKRSNQIHVQTWHGAQLKCIGMDVMNRPAANVAIDPSGQAKRPTRGESAGVIDTAQEFADMMDRARRWDYVLSTSTFSSNVWRQAYPANYELLEVGYPRNDELFSATADQVADARRKLGIPDGKITVLYAPTYRDIEQDSSVRIDFANLIDQVGEDFVFIIRTHYTTKLPTEVLDLIAQGRAIDGTKSTTINDLFLASDVLITDYSSLMFDFVALDRPIVIFADDWEHYRDVRGTYFDITKSTPGALAMSQDELTQILKLREYESTENADRRHEFRDEFCNFDRGTASAAVVELITRQ